MIRNAGKLGISKRSLFSAFSSKRSQIFRTRGGARRSATGGGFAKFGTVEMAALSRGGRLCFNPCFRGGERGRNIGKLSGGGFRGYTLPGIVGALVRYKRRT
jgi:hypothetical protein